MRRVPRLGERARRFRSLWSSLPPLGAGETTTRGSGGGGDRWRKPLGVRCVARCVFRDPICRGHRWSRVCGTGLCTLWTPPVRRSPSPPLRGGEKRGSLLPSGAFPRRSDSQENMGLVPRSPQPAFPACRQDQFRFASACSCRLWGRGLLERPRVSICNLRAVPHGNVDSQVEPIASVERTPLNIRVPGLSTQSV